MRSELRELLGFCTNLPSMPSVAVQVLELGQDPEVDPGALVTIVSRDPALASRILRISNSPLYALARRCDNLRQAVLALGVNAAMSLALSFSLADTLRHRGAHAEAMERTWRRALIAATASHCLGEMVRMPRREELFLAAMLQDLGILALDAAMPDTYSRLLAQSQSHDELLDIEREALGTDHGEAGTWLMQRWDLPAPLALAATAAHDPTAAEVAPDLQRFMCVIALAGRVADLYISCRRQSDALELLELTERWLELGNEHLQEVLDQVGGSLPEIERAFDTRLASASQIAAVMDQARELLTMRNLQLIQQAAEHQRRMSDMERSSRRWREEATRDSLTGLYNRRFFDERLQREFGFASEQGLPLVLGFMDLDHFKDVNDRHGHEMGDAVLEQIGRTLREHTRDGDLVVRYGGEEFIVLLPGAGLEAAKPIFERLRAAIEAVEYQTRDDATLRVTVSIGLAARTDAMSPLDLVRQADRALYSAKQSGRNRVECARPPAP